MSWKLFLLIWSLHYLRCRSIRVAPVRLVPGYKGLGTRNNQDSVILSGGSLKVKLGENGQYVDLLRGIDPRAEISVSGPSGAFVSFSGFDMATDRIDLTLGLLPEQSRFVCHSRIKRWWMAPSFGTTADDVPVETQLLLLELGNRASLMESTSLLSLFGKDSRAFARKQYAALIPLIDFDRGFRSTLFGQEGGAPAGKEKLAMRMESGCEDVVANEVHNALYIAFGNDPYEMLETAYATISQASGSFRTRKTKPLPPGVDTFGWCSWDAFYSSVDTKKVSAAVDSLAKIGYAPKFVIIDDGWQSVAPASSHRATAEAASDGDLSGAQIDGSVALQSTKGGSNPIMQFIQSEVLRFYSEKVEKGKPDSLSVKIWSTVSRTLLKDKLLDFFALKTDFSKRLTSWKANSKFEDALSGQTFKKFVKGLKERRGINQVFVWHALSGYWGGISDDAKDDLPKELTRSKYDNSTEFTTSCDLSEVRIKYSKPTPHLLLVEPALAWDPGSLAGVGSVALGSLSQLYERMHKYLADAGVDGVKVDAQSGIGAFGQGYGGGSTFARTVVRAVEDSVKTAFAKLPEAPTLYSRFFQSSKKVPESQFHLEGCMCHSTENLYNFRETSMVRASDDFYPKNSASQTIHIASCAYNSVMLGEIAVVDWDMFHSKHECALIHAVARAVSGGPVYVSDGIGNHDVSILKRLVLPGGDVLRTNQPARPTVDCLFSDVMRDGQTALKVFSLNKGGGGVVAAFNVQGSSWDRKARKYVQHNDNVADVCAEVRANQLGTPFLNNAKGSSVGKYAIWSVLGQELNILNSKNEAVSVTIPARSCEVFAVSNVHEVGQYRGLFSRGKEMVIEWAPLGLIDMFNPGGAIVQLLTSRKYYEAKFVVRGCGRLGVYTDRVPSYVTINGRRAEFSYEAARKLLVVDVSGPVANRSISIMW